jgi:hypothetical protein
MTLERLIEWFEVQAYPGDAYEAAAAHLRRLAALERERDILAADLMGWREDNTRLREALHIIRITGPEREHEIAREALAGAPDEESDA